MFNGLVFWRNNFKKGEDFAVVGPVSLSFLNYVDFAAETITL
jgi:hypothetical protein